MSLTGSSKILRINLGFDYNNFVIAKIVHSLSKIKEIFVILLDLITVISKREMFIIYHSFNEIEAIRLRQDLHLGFNIFFFDRDANFL